MSSGENSEIYRQKYLPNRPMTQTAENKNNNELQAEKEVKRGRSNPRV